MYDINLTEIKTLVAESNRPVPVEVADLILAVMQKRFGNEFKTKFAEYNDKHSLRAATCEILTGLNQEDVERGLLRMRHQKYCPSLPVFRELCENWKGENEAWADALTWRKNKHHQITTLTKQAYDTVSVMIMNTENNTLATRNLESVAFAFREVYRSLVDQAKCKNMRQEFWVPENNTIESNKERYKIAHSPSVLDRLTDHQKTILLRQRELVASGMTHKDALNQARRELCRANINKNMNIEKDIQGQTTELHHLIRKGHSALDAFQQLKEK